VKVAIIGTRGIPNNYGGFETLVENLVLYLAKDLDITVYCSSKDLETTFKEYHGATLRYIPISSHGWKGIIYDSVALSHAVFHSDKVLILAFGAGFVVPFLTRYKKKFIINIGGLDWKRSKWSPFAQKVIKTAERNLLRHSRWIISDNVGIQNYIKSEYSKDSELITYGGDQAQRLPVSGNISEKYPFINHPYAFIVTRIQQDNNIDMMLNAFQDQSALPLVIVGNWNASSYGRNLKSRYLAKNNVILLEAIYDRIVLDILRSNCRAYIHGHSAGGTNPSLVEAMYLGLPVIAFASGYNEYTTMNKAIYFKNQYELREIITHLDSYNLEKIAGSMKAIADENYRWETVAQKYRDVFTKT
jgi:glycosyltransferase involved in cell wall biosynthesis